MPLSLEGRIEQAKVADIILNEDSSINVDLTIKTLAGAAFDLSAYYLEFNAGSVSINSNDDPTFIYKSDDVGGTGVLALKKALVSQITNLTEYTLRVIGPIEEYTFLIGRVRFDERRLFR